MQPDQNQQISDKMNPIAVMQPGEQFICEIKRHPIGIIGIFLASGLLILLMALFFFVLLPQLMTNTASTQSHTIGIGLFLLLSLLVLAFAFIANVVYWGNRWVLTSDSVTQMQQTGLFAKQSSSLSLGNLEDVTAEQNGILAQLLNYGVLKVETAGERSKFQFIFCPNPNFHAKEVLDARERFEQFTRANEIQAQYQKSAVQNQPPAGPAV